MKFRIYTPAFSDNSGGIMVLYKLAKDLHDMGHDSKLISWSDRPENAIYNTYTDNDDVNDCVVVYPEIVSGNPLNASKIIRWILCELGKNCDGEIYKTWNDTDMIYHYSSYNKDNKQNLKFLFSLYINPEFKNTNNSERTHQVFTLRKSDKFHKNITYMHDIMTECLYDDLNHNDLIHRFNIAKYFYCYDPYSWMIFMAALCGCIPIVYPIEGVSKKEWTDTFFCKPYLDSIGKDYLYGVAYGIDDMQYAQDTIHLATEEQYKIVEYGKITIQSMINDLYNNTFVTNKDIFYQ